MAIPEFFPILEAFGKVRPTIDRWIGEGAGAEMASMLEVKSMTDRPRIMVYGVYNAGKSTLINALIGTEEASMADRPETAEIKGYDWRGYTLLDTPGIDAPIEHEKVTEESLNRSDVVLFVAAAGGVAAESATWESLIEIVSRGRQVMLVINDKMALDRDGEDYLTVINSARAHLQKAAEKSGIKNILDKVDVCVVNARSALKGRIQNKSVLIKSSGLADLEKKLFYFFEKCNFAVVCRSAATDVLNLVDKTSIALETKAGSDESRSVEELGQAVRKSKEQTILKTRSRLEIIVENARSRVISYCRSKSENPELPEDALDNIALRMENELTEVFSGEIEDEFRNLNLDMERVSRFAASGRIGRSPIDIDAPQNSRPGETAKHLKTVGEKLGSSLGSIPVENMTSAVKSALMFGKDMSKKDFGKFLKPLFHKKGEVRLGETAERFSKTVGPALGVASGVFSLGMAIKQDYDEHRALERLAKAIDDAAADYLASFKQDASRWISEQVKVVFAKLEDSVKERQREIQTESTELQHDRNLLMGAQQTLARYLD